MNNGLEVFDLNNINLKELYREYLLDFMKNDFNDFIEAEILSYEEFKEQLSQNNSKEL